MVRQVYGIVACQLALTAVVAALIMANAPLQQFMLGSVAFQIVNAIIPFAGRWRGLCIPYRLFLWTVWKWDVGMYVVIKDCVWGCHATSVAIWHLPLRLRNGGHMGAHIHSKHNSKADDRYVPVNVPRACTGHRSISRAGCPAG